jgi:hypothetical protein
MQWREKLLAMLFPLPLSVRNTAPRQPIALALPIAWSDIVPSNDIAHTQLKMFSDSKAFLVE